ncbi:MAG: hypothetical protein ACFE0Q_03340 [Anaerolineae bacterium]
MTQLKTILNDVQEKMTVMESANGEKIGTVEFVRYGESTDSVDLPEIETIAQTLREALDPDVSYPDEVYKRLYNEGFVRVDRGLQSDLFVFPNQIERVSDDVVYLNVSKDNLLKG